MTTTDETGSNAGKPVSDPVIRVTVTETTERQREWKVSEIVAELAECGEDPTQFAGWTVSDWVDGLRETQPECIADLTSTIVEHDDEWEVEHARG